MEERLLGKALGGASLGHTCSSRFCTGNISLGGLSCFLVGLLLDGWPPASCGGYRSVLGLGAPLLDGRLSQ